MCFSTQTSPTFDRGGGPPAPNPDPDPSPSQSPSSPSQSGAAWGAHHPQNLRRSPRRTHRRNLTRGEGVSLAPVVSCPGSAGPAAPPPVRRTPLLCL